MAYGDLLDQLGEKEFWDAVDFRDSVPEGWSRSFDSQVGERPDHAWKQAVSEIRDLVKIATKALSRGAIADDEAAFAEMGCFDPKVNGAGTVTAVAAAYAAARSAARPMSGLLRTAFLKRADTDTLASMTASILGALHGPDWLVDLSRGVQDSDYVAGFECLARGIAEADTSRRTSVFEDGDALVQRRDPVVSGKGLKKFTEALADRITGDTGEFVDGRPFEVREKVHLSAKGNITVTRWRLRLADGQTIVIDDTRKDMGRSQVGERLQRPPTVRTANEPRSSVSTITLFVNDLPRVAGFYRNVIGLPVHGTGGGYVELGPGLRLRQRENPSPVDPDALLEIIVPSLTDVSQRLGSGTPAILSDALEIRDPEGRPIIVRERLM
jgi:hypothetical protein